MTSARRPAGVPNKQAADGPHEGHPTTNPAAPGREAEEAAGVGSEEAAGVGSEEAAGGDAGAAVDADLDALLADTERQRDEYLELAQRTKADFENYRKRAARETEEAERRAKSTLARELVPALDSLERALQSAGVGPDDGPGEEPSEPQSREVSAQEALAQGVQLVLRELHRTLERAGVEAFDPAGEEFDPAWHEALATRPADDGSGKVIETIERGYRLDGQLIRPARVIVGE
jgi:molecular chaperone GrpE